ncbi:hypothetical protein PACILC2_26790 [Paenibacillus cisolokensis]|uniref:Uncharacterized protein n=1 Tax=Paenibacillus cisolokensis TaxID=1658519 RepID=A0ABQ4N881_9BACL|nr:hypothetical protein PACILC2_26790 [Paenibacillus cisolokensis]
MRLGRQRNVNGHLVAVKVRIVRGTYERMQTDSPAFHQNRLERLNAETVQRGSAVEQHRMLLDHFFEHVPDFRAYALDLPLGALDVMGKSFVYKLLHDERLEQLERHLFRKPALIHFQARPDNDNGTAGIVDPFAQQVLTEAALLPFQHMAERFQRPVARTGNGTSAAAIVDQRVDRFLQHPFFVLHDNVRRAEIQKPLQTVVPVNDAAVQIVQVGSGETSAVKLHHRPELRRNDGQHVENHPFRTIARIAERFDHFQPLDRTVAALALSGPQLFLQRLHFFVDVDILQKLLDGFSAHARLKTVTVFSR